MECIAQPQPEMQHLQTRRTMLSIFPTTVILSFEALRAVQVVAARPGKQNEPTRLVNHSRLLYYYHHTSLNDWASILLFQENDRNLTSQCLMTSSHVDNNEDSVDPRKFAGACCIP